MTKSELEKIAHYLVDQGISALHRYTDEQNPVIDYVAIFSRDDEEFKNLERVAETIGEEIDKETGKTGRTFLLHSPLATSAGMLRLLKIRRPDNTRPQRGAPDFKIPNYPQFKQKYLGSNGNFTLMPRKEYEMIELKGVDVLVYIPDNTLGDRIKKG